LSDAAQNKESYSFDIPSAEVNGPLNLKETVQSAQTSEPEWSQDQISFSDIEVLDGVPIKYSLFQLGDVDTFTIRVDLQGFGIGPESVEHVRSHLEQVLGLRDDLPSFYRTFADEKPLASTFRRLRGLRLMRGTDFYESLIFSILSQNSSAKKMNKTARLLMQNYGSRISFPDGSEGFLFPRAQSLASTTVRQLKATTAIGYRASSVVNVSKLVSEGKLDFGKFTSYSYEEALRLLLELPGVGPKVADCFLLYGIGRLDAAPVDIWIHRIVSRLYFKNRKISRLMTARFLREHFGKWAGYAQLYLFDYARREGIGAATRKSK
jgi:N-glycosylase/DNA lyase